MQMTQESSHNPLMPIDTLAISKKLQASGMPVKQAETQAEVFAEIITFNLASKTDIENVRKDIESMRKDTNISIESMRKDTNISTESMRKDTNASIENMRKDTNTSIENLRKDLLLEIGRIKYDIMKLLVPLMTGQLIAAAGLMKIFIH